MESEQLEDALSVLDQYRDGGTEDDYGEVVDLLTDVKNIGQFLLFWFCRVRKLDCVTLKVFTLWTLRFGENFELKFSVEELESENTFNRMTLVKYLSHDTIVFFQSLFARNENDYIYQLECKLQGADNFTKLK